MNFFNNQKKLTVFDRVVLAVNVLAGLALMFSYLAPFINPRYFWLVGMAGLGYPFLLPANAIFVIFWLFRRSRWVLFPVVFLVIGLPWVSQNYGLKNFCPLSSNPPKENLRVMTYNVHGFRALDKVIGTPVPDEMAGIIHSSRPDIVAIIEFNSIKADQGAIYRSLQRSLGLNHYYFKPHENDEWDSTGIALFSRFPIIRSGFVAPSPQAPETEAVFVDLSISGKVTRVYGIHLQSVRFGFAQHKFLKQLRPLNRGGVKEIGIITDKLRTAFSRRSHQVELIKAHMRRCPYPYLVMGDFNDTPMSYSVNRIGEGLTNAFAEKGSGAGITYHRDFMPVQIDYIFTSKQFEVLSYMVVGKKLSDHFPIVSDLRMR
ncbi:endonuclease/exonuclease/phosphatase family protein [Hufsiella ginkgonis]|uniref:Endonuclease/exonuclease/phosphatase domain-containing protein n=1 Tax=Hufsiella ginkgonis TaxID=2695274 RepID=A0A7K1Y299_9SPHI|nr:endonuclease/exonuclease/phosphatase family protein [Hufsiella ginkgonis]MXV17403.1 hypothetical protein [Hufsiella ginkgonis]